MLLVMSKTSEIQALAARCFIETISFSVNQVMMNECFHISKIIP